MTRVLKLRLVLPARFARSGDVAAREIAERLMDTNHGHENAFSDPIRLADTGQTAAQIGLQAGQQARRRARTEGGGS